MGSQPIYKKWWIWVLGIIFLPGFCTAIFDRPSTTSSPPPAPTAEQTIKTSDKFRSMTPEEHLAAANKSLTNSRIAQLHLDAIPNTAPEYASIQDVKQKMAQAAEEQKKAAIAKQRADKAKKEAAVKMMVKKKDKFENTTWYFDRSTPQTNATNNISAYIGQKDGQVWLRYKISYRGDSWLFIQNYKLMLDEKVLDITPRKVDRDNYSYVWEWSDEPVDAPALLVLAAITVSKNAKIRYEGRQYRKDRTITQNEKQAIKNVLFAFNALGGKIE
jgi:hypothetical protein